MVDDRELLIDGPESSDRIVVLAHGAGAPMDSPFMTDFARGLVNHDLRVVRFEFEYMLRRRTTGKGGRPDPGPALEQRWQAVIDHLGEPGRLVIGGKSMGGRIASMVADRSGVAGLICLGYPFHPPGRPEKLRTAHLLELHTPALILHGTRDPFGKPEEIDAYGLSPAIRVAYVEEGDHSFKPRVRSGRTLEQNLEEAVATAARFVAELQLRA